MSPEHEEGIRAKQAEADAPPIELQEVDLTGEGTDRAFVTPSGTRFRARVVVSDRAHARPGVGAAAIAAPTKVTLSITLALLDEQNQVQKLGEGYRIFDRHEILVSDDNLATPGYDLEAIIMEQIARRAAEAERVVTNQARAAEVLRGGWGIEL